MTIKTTAQGTERKRMVQTIANWMGEPAQYCGAPTFVYKVGYITVDKTGTLHLNDMVDSNEVERLLECLREAGVEHEAAEYDSDQPEPAVEEPLEDCPPAYGTSDSEGHGVICISMPRSIFTGDHIANLHHILEAKGNLIKRALDVMQLPIQMEDTKVCFPWFKAEVTPDELMAYEQFICKLCEMARTQKRITAKEKEVDNEKYTFRCFLLRLGFIGEEYKTARKILLQNLTGSSAFKGGQNKEDTQCE